RAQKPDRSTAGVIPLAGLVFLAPSAQSHNWRRELSGAASASIRRFERHVHDAPGQRYRQERKWASEGVDSAARRPLRLRSHPEQERTPMPTPIIYPSNAGENLYKGYTPLLSPNASEGERIAHALCFIATALARVDQNLAVLASAMQRKL